MPLLMVTTSFSMKTWNSFVALTVLTSIKGIVNLFRNPALTDSHQQQGATI
jgi:hypothetical protein